MPYGVKQIGGSMSGGHYDYMYLKVAQLADDIELGTGEHSEAPPELRARFKTHLHKVARALKAIEYNDSGDGDPEEVDLLTEILGPC